MPRKQTSPKVSAIASRVMKDVESATPADIKALAASALGQDETAGHGPMTEDEVRALFPNEDLKIENLGHGVRSISASWEVLDDRGKPQQRRQSIMIPNGEFGLGAAAHTLRELVDELKGEGK